MQVNGVGYQFVRGSDVIRDGMYIEVSIEGSSPLLILAEVFYSDQTAAFTLSCFEENIPLDVVEELINIAKKHLPPSSSAPW